MKVKRKTKKATELENGNESEGSDIKNKHTTKKTPEKKNKNNEKNDKNNEKKKRGEDQEEKQE